MILPTGEGKMDRFIKVDLAKFRLKPEDEIKSLFLLSEGKNKVAVFACKKCFHPFSEDGVREDCRFIYELIKDVLCKELVLCLETEFLCNEHHLENKLEELNFGVVEKDLVAVYACGIGVQVVSSCTGCEVIALADTIPQGGYHGITLYGDRCKGCAQCYLSLTGGICPVVNCAKGLVNGPCGGAKNDKCEVSAALKIDKECAWENIYKRLSALMGYTGKVKFSYSGEGSRVGVEIIDYTKFRYGGQAVYKNLIKEKRSASFYGGVYPFEKKEYAADKVIRQLPEPEVVVLPLLQHTGQVCEPLVKVKDEVKIGQKIGDAAAYISAPVHSPVSGRVISIEERIHPIIKQKVPCVVIENDGRESTEEGLIARENYEGLSREELINIIREKGVVGLGGAMFPTHVKISAPKRIDTLILNGCECEPYLTCDYRVMLERTESLFRGMKILMKILDVEKGYIVVEDNKKEAIEKLNKTRKEMCEEGIQVVEVRTKYPQGAERMLIKKVLGREVPRGGLPLDVGVVVNNVQTAIAVHDAVVYGMPLIKRVITVSGEGVKNPGNYDIKLGTLVKDIWLLCVQDDISSFDNYVVKMGGPMMGIRLETLEFPVIKGTSGIVALRRPFIESQLLDRECIKCGRCVDVCPMELYPLRYWFNFRNKSYEASVDDGIMNCIECGCCEYVCSSKIALVEVIKRMKQMLRGKKN
jgi:electron transport complex protein RnfC